MQPANTEIYHMARRVARYLATHTQQVGREYLEVYEDNKIAIAGRIGGTTVQIKLRRPGDQTQQVYFAQDDTKRNPHRLNPGGWITYLQALDEKARPIEERNHAEQHEANTKQYPERYAPADDSDMFESREEG